MTMPKKQFEEHLFVYGSNVEQWPEEIREAGKDALERSVELRALIAEEAHFEAFLKARRFEEPSRDLEQRIISASMPANKKARHGVGAFFSELLQELNLPKPVLTAVSVLFIVTLLVGFTIGASYLSDTSMEPYQIRLEEFLYDEGEVL
jgi:hypothetical protein